MTTSAPPSLIPGGQPAFSANIAAGPGTEHTLMDLMYDGFYALFMLKNGNGPQANVAVDRRKIPRLRRAY